MQSVTVQEAKTHLSRLLRAVQEGERIEIRRGSLPVAVIGPAEHKESFADLRGAFEGRFEVPADFDEPDPEIERLFGTAD